MALDRAGFSVGVIDGQPGGKTRKALAAFRQARGLPEAKAKQPDAAAWAALGDELATTSYEVTEADLAGPFLEEIPKDLEQQGSLDQLSYTSPLEMLAERFHASPALLRALNPPDAALQANQTIVVPNVDPMTLPETAGRRRAAKSGARTGTAQRAGSDASPGARTAASTPASAAAGAGAGAGANTGAGSGPNAGTGSVEVVVSRASSDLIVRDAAGVTTFYAPVSSGSEHDPLPIGDWKVRGVYLLPRFFYNPELFWDADAAHAKTQIAAGPNNPVGPVWIDLDRPHYGLHGTPEPSHVGVTQSHGCVRLTNWDALRLAALVTDGTLVHFEP